MKDIGAVTLVGQRRREIQVAVDPNRLTAYGLSVEQLALTRAHRQVEGEHRAAAWRVVLDHVAEARREGVIAAM